MIRLEIPETGISLAELILGCALLGHENFLTGEVVRIGGGLTLTSARPRAQSVSRVPEADMDALTARLAESIYRLTQPYRYAIYLMRHEQRPADAAPIFQELALHGSPEERRWSYNTGPMRPGSRPTTMTCSLRMYRQAHQADLDALQPTTTLGQTWRFWPVRGRPPDTKREVALTLKSDPGEGITQPGFGNRLRRFGPRHAAGAKRRSRTFPDLSL